MDLDRNARGDNGRTSAHQNNQAQNQAQNFHPLRSTNAVRRSTSGQREIVRTYGRIQGRITSGQKNALERWGGKYLIPISDNLVSQSCFPSAQPLVLDLGCGMCDALIQLAQNHPDKNWIGIDVYQPGIGRGCALIERLGLTNVRLIHHDLIEVLECNIPPRSIEKIYILFPDPWPKKRHHKRRLLQKQFIDRLRRVLIDGGRCRIATDWREYAGQIEQLFSHRHDFEPIAAQSEPALPVTKFARRTHDPTTVSDFLYRAV